MKKFKEIDGFKFIVNGYKAEIVEYTGSEEVITIPEALDYNVTSIGERAFYNNRIIAKITIPASVTTLKKEAFSHCENLTEVIIDNGLSTISSFCFSNCIALESLKLPKSLTTIYRGAFRNCDALKEIEIPENITVLNAELFCGCEELEHVGLPYGLDRICSDAFKDCTQLTGFYYYGKRAINSVMVTDRSLKENEFPAQITYIGDNAFEGCSSLERIRIPYKVNLIGKGVFKNCTALSTVYIHNSLKEIKEEAFRGCENLKEIKLPLITKKIADNAFSTQTGFLCEESSFAAVYAVHNDLSCRHVAETPPPLVSHLVPLEDEQATFSERAPFYTEQDLQECAEKFEMRPPAYEKMNRFPLVSEKDEMSLSRFAYKTGRYVNKNKTAKNKAVIMLTGDLMCRAQQQNEAAAEEGYSFDASFLFIKDILAQSDFAIANLEAIVSPSAPFTHEVEYVNNVAHLNAPESYLYALKKASFDAVINAQNHIYDGGVQGLFETLDMQNKHQLMHTGAFASKKDKRYLLVEINGIRIAFVAGQDIARQQIRKTNFTKVGRETLFSYLSPEEAEAQQIAQDISNAKAEGADFVIAFCHWGKKYSHSVTERQVNFAEQVANAGANYIFGSQPHRIQPYDIITTTDKRQVPVFYSAGSLISDVSVHLPATRDTLITELVLGKDLRGRARIESEKYYPCRVMDFETDTVNYTVVPTAMTFEGEGSKNKRLAEAEARIENALGDKIKKKAP
ncbi:MAG: leucine-rich repeat protein [Eggerthellaceae bacterium]|nr:leucine-rich repeat protein [Eggerthellaceae bacterium]